MLAFDTKTNENYSPFKRCGELVETDGEWGKFINNGVSLGLSWGVYRGLNNLNATSNQKKFLRGFTDVQISGYSGIINYGLDKKNQK